MVKRPDQGSAERGKNQGENECQQKASKIRSFKMLAAHGMRETERHEPTPETVCKAQEIADHTIRIGRLKLLFIAAKVATHSDTTEVKYSRHDSRVAGLFRFMEYIDKRLHQARPWLSGKLWPCNHLPFLRIQQADAFG